MFTRIRNAWSMAAARDWTEQLEKDFQTHFLEIDPTVLGGTLSRVTVVNKQAANQHAGYSCHAHENPWSTRSTGCFKSMQPDEHFKAFCIWQDNVHRKLHVIGTERECENLRSGAGQFVEANDVEMAARDVEDLVAEGLVAVGENGVTTKIPALCRLLYTHQKTAGITFPKMSKGKKDQVCNNIFFFMPFIGTGCVVRFCALLQPGALILNGLHSRLHQRVSCLFRCAISRSVNPNKGMYDISTFNNVPWPFTECEKCFSMF